MKNKKGLLNWLIFLPLVIYFIGIIFIKPTDIESLKKSGIAKQEEYYYEDEFCDEYEGETLVEIKGIGKVLTYKDVYFSAIPMFIIAMIIGAIILGKGDVSDGRGLLYAIFSFCIIGILLIYITSKGNIVSTILFWLSIISAHYILNHFD